MPFFAGIHCHPATVKLAYSGKKRNNNKNARS